MNRLIRETDQVIKLNLRQLAVFEVLFRLVAGTFYIRLANQLLRFSLRMAGYSYLTMSNMGAFLWRPVTIICGALALAVGMVLLVIEIGGLITAYQASAYSRKIDSLAILRGALGKTWDEYNKRDWKLLPLALAEYLTMNSYLLIRSLLLIAFFSSFSTSGRKRRVLRSHAKSGRIRSRINGIGIRFPTRQIGIARQVGIFKNAGPAARIPPLSSRIGIIEIIKIISSLAALPPR